MSRRVTIVMYHFVRNLRHARYPEIKGLDTLEFAGQLDYIRKHYNVVRMEDLFAAAKDRSVQLPPRSLLLTFDDGYIDHFETVFPLLDRHRMQGSFFAPARAIIERKVLDVNKIHFLLASMSDKSRLVQAIESRIDVSRNQYDLKPLAYYRETYAHANRWDTAEVIYIKRVLQKGLPESLRTPMIAELFSQFVSADETAFAEELYVSEEQLQCMVRNGMHVGSHSYDHYWLDTLDPAAQENQIRQSKNFLGAVGVDLDNWVMCYPYGGFNQSLLEILRRHNCRIGLTTEPNIADMDASDPLTLARIDTNDLPKLGDAAVNQWTQAA